MDCGSPAWKPCPASLWTLGVRTHPWGAPRTAVYVVVCVCAAGCGEQHPLLISSGGYQRVSLKPGGDFLICWLGNRWKRKGTYIFLQKQLSCSSPPINNTPHITYHPTLNVSCNNIILESDSIIPNSTWAPNSFTAVTFYIVINHISRSQIGVCIWFSALQLTSSVISGKSLKTLWPWVLYAITWKH